MEAYIPQYISAWEANQYRSNENFDNHLFEPGTLIKIGQHAPIQVIEPTVVTDNEKLYKRLLNITKKYDGNLPADILLNERENLLKEMKGNDWRTFFENKNLLSKIEWDTHIKTSENERLKELFPEQYLSLLKKEELYTEHSFWSINPFNIQYDNCENIHVVPMTIDLSACKDFATEVFKDLFKNENAVPPAKVDLFEFYRASVTVGLSFFSYGMEQTPEEAELEHRYNEMKVSQLVQLGEHEFQLVRHSDTLPKNIPANVNDRLFPDLRRMERSITFDPAQAAYNNLPKYFSTEGEPLYEELSEVAYNMLSKFEDIVESRLKRQGSKIDARYKGIPTNMLTDAPKEQQSMIQPRPKGKALTCKMAHILGIEGKEILKANYIKLCDYQSTILQITD